MAKDRHGSEPLHLCAHRGHADMIDLFISKGALGERPAERKKLVWMILFLSWGWENESLLTTERLLQSFIFPLCPFFFVIVNNKNFAGDTALHYAANKGHNEALRLLLMRGAVIDSRNGNGWTPLHLAVVSAHFETVRILVEKGASLHSQDSKGNTAIHLACESNNIGMVEFLLKRGAKTNIENKKFQTPVSPPRP